MGLSLHSVFTPTALVFGGLYCVGAGDAGIFAYGSRGRVGWFMTNVYSPISGTVVRHYLAADGVVVEGQKIVTLYAGAGSYVDVMAPCDGVFSLFVPRTSRVGRAAVLGVIRAWSPSRNPKISVGMTLDQRYQIERALQSLPPMSRAEFIRQLLDLGLRSFLASVDPVCHEEST